VSPFHVLSATQISFLFRPDLASSLQVPDVSGVVPRRLGSEVSKAEMLDLLALSTVSQGSLNAELLGYLKRLQRRYSEDTLKEFAC